MSDELELAKQGGISLEALARAPIWLAAGILGVPALIALGAGWFITQGVEGRLRTLEQYNLSEIHQLNDLTVFATQVQNHRWDAMRRTLEMDVEMEKRICINLAKNESQRDYCMATLGMIPPLPDHGEEKKSNPSSGPPSP